MVGDPLRRGNTEDNTPAILHTSLVPGDKLTLTVAPKGFGSENMSRLKMLTPAAKAGGHRWPLSRRQWRWPVPTPARRWCWAWALAATLSWWPMLAKKALCRSVSQRNPDPFYAELEERMLQAVNSTGVGPQGFGGETTALAVNIETYPTHIAGLPVARERGLPRHPPQERDTVILRSKHPSTEYCSVYCNILDNVLQ